MTAPVAAHVAVGSNVDPLANVLRGLRRLHYVAPIEAASRFYWTAALGPDGLPRRGDPDFLNGMVRLRTRMAPLALKRVLHRIEAETGRLRGPDPYAPRTLDLDLVTHGREVLDGDLPIRRHLAACLLELDPGFEVAPGTRLRDPGGLAMRPAEGLRLPIQVAATAPL